MAQRASYGRLDAMVLDADERQSLVTVRSLGRTGLRVGAFDDTPYPPAATSRWCSARRRLPDGADSWRYLDAVLDLVHRHRPRVVFSARDSTIEALRERRAEIERETMLALAAEPALEIAVSKERTLALAQRLGIPVPLSVPIADPGAAADATVRTGLPAVVKPVRSWVQPADGAGRRLSCVVVTNGPEARRATEAAMRAGGQVLLQEWLRGSREAVSLICVDGKIRARFAQVARRMLPPLGGSSIVRESIPLPADLTEAAEALVLAAELEGYVEVEFRRDVDGTGYLMEMNPRLSASVEIAVRSGVDFPRLLYTWASGAAMPSPPAYRAGVQMRWLGGDIQWLQQTLAARGRPETVPPATALRQFARDCMTPYFYDYAMVRDPSPALTATSRMLAKAVLRRYRSHRLEVAS
jgi:predicted ATP-grasp superfamily ATP-dependent carboligase